MTLLVSGVLIWAIVHLMPAFSPSFRQSLIDKLGPKLYRGLFALAILASLGLIVIGWQSTPEEYLYALPPGTKTVMFVLICVALIIIGAAFHPSSIKRVIRHPMLTGVFIWAAAHLLVNGTVRAVVLFGGLGLWAVLEIILINRRDGAYEKPPRPGFSEELRGTFISAGVLLLLLVTHPFFAGVTPFPR
jgi:uncharacterized membrane protein